MTPPADRFASGFGQSFLRVVERDDCDVCAVGKIRPTWKEEKNGKLENEKISLYVKKVSHSFLHDDFPVFSFRPCWLFVRESRSRDQNAESNVLVVRKSKMEIIMHSPVKFVFVFVLVVEISSTSFSCWCSCLPPNDERLPLAARLLMFCNIFQRCS